MSRIGKMPVNILAGVKIDIKDGTIKVEGPKGKLSREIPRGVEVKVDSGKIIVEANEKISPNAGALQGLTRTLINNMVVGCHTGFTKELDVVGVGYRAAVKGNILNLIIGYSHPIDYELPTGISAKVENNTHIVITGFDKILVGMVAAKIRSFKEPEPYQGKGIKYTNETIIRKQGKAAGAK